MRRFAPLLSALALAACNGSSDAPQHPSTEAPAAPAASATATSAKRYGEAITAKDAAALSDIAKNPAAYKSRTILTTGKVTRACQERGCWMAIADGAGNATVRMHAHSFFIPTTSAGKNARVQGSVMLTKDGHECDEMEAVGAALEIDATGVELVD
jgi:hypothetical protein